MNKEKRERPYFFRRIVAYLIDIIFVTLLATAISMVFIDNTKYQKRTEELKQLVIKLSNEEITKEEYSKQYEVLNYYMAVDSVGTTIINCAVALVYYVILCFFCHGITLGKYLLKLQIVSANNKELNMGNYLIRGLFVNLILSNLINIIFVYTMNKDAFINVYPKISSVLSIYLLVTILIMMYREDGRGLHDLMSNTKVISTKVPRVKEETKEEVKEAKVLEEKQIKEEKPKKTKKETKTENKEPKKTTKKSTKKEVKKK